MNLFLYTKMKNELNTFTQLTKKEFNVVNFQDQYD